jgi:SpoVK/Ycf46/Vps4 family AAA+-type ATPase
VSASGQVMQLIRAHYRGQEDVFAATAVALARSSRVASIRVSIEDLVRDGLRAKVQDRSAQSHHKDGPRNLAPLHPKSLANGMLEKLPRQTFDKLMLPEDVQAFFDELSTELEYTEELEERGLRPRNRVLLYGPPGCGKTSCAAALAAARGVPAYGVSLPRLISKYVGATTENLGQLFDSLQKDTLVVFDELDAMGATRGSVEQSAGKEFNGITNALLTLLDRRSAGIIVATTNRIDILDPALVRRFDEQVLIPDPTWEQKLALAERLCVRHAVPVPDGIGECLNYDAVTKLVLREARKHVMREILAQEGQGDDEPEERPESDRELN